MNDLSFCTPIEENEVLLKVINLVLTAQEEIAVTHSDADDSKVVPDKNYFDALQKKIKEGIKITRYVFSSKEPLSQDSQGVSQVYAGDCDSYQRAVVVDQSRAMFKLGDKFYYSEFQPLVSALLADRKSVV